MTDETYQLSEKNKDQIQNAYISYGFPVMGGALAGVAGGRHSGFLAALC